MESNIPVPDPSLLTTEQLRRELGSLREIFEARMNASEKARDTFFDRYNLLPTEIDKQILHLKETIDTRLTAMDLANGLKHENLTRVPTEVDKQISHLKELLLEKFASVEKQFVERDVRTVAAATAATTAVNAALQAQKEAAGAQNDSLSASIAKSEAATVKQIDGILALLASNSTSLTDKIATVNARLDRGDGSETGVSRKTNQMNTYIGIGIAILALILSFYNASTKAAVESGVQVTPPSTTTITSPPAK